MTARNSFSHFASRRGFFSLACVLALTGFFANAKTGQAADGDGGYAAPYLQIPIGARPAGMGGAYVAVSDDPAGVYYNPAGMTLIPKTRIGSSYRVLGLGRKLLYIAAASPIQGNAILGAHWLHAGTEGVPARDGDGDLLGNELAESHNQFGFIFAKRFERYFSLGASFSYVDVKLAELTTNSVGIDVGAIIHIDQFFNREERQRMSISDLRLGFVVRQLAKKFNWNSLKYELAYNTDPLGAEQSDNVPLEIAGGLSGKLFDSKLLLAVDVINNEQTGIDFRAGGEYNIVPEGWLRMGYGLEQVAFGGGYEFAFGKQFLRVDYAFSTNRAGADSEHIISFDFRL